MADPKANKNPTQNNQKTSVQGKYLIAWNTAHEYIKQKGSKLNYADYQITFSENENEYLINFTKPLKERILGGGVGKCKISKKDYSVIEFQLIR